VFRFNVVNHSANQGVLQEMRVMLRAAYTYPEVWLQQRQQRMQHGQAAYMHQMGWAEDDATLTGHFEL